MAKKHDDLDQWIDENTPEAQQIQRLRVRLKEMTASEKGALARANKAEELLELALAVRKPRQPAKIKSRARGKREGCPGFLVSDTHYGEVVYRKRVNGLNAYNKEIAEARTHKLARGIAWLVNWWSLEWTIKEGFIWLGGDIHSGSIHKELAETNDMGTTEAFLFAQRMFIQLFDYVLTNTQLEKLNVPCVGGNHDRLTDKLSIKNQKDYSMAWLLYQTLALHYKDEKRIEFFIPDGTILYPFTVFDWTFRFAHGYQIKYSDGVGGLTIPMNKKIQKWDKAQKCHYTCIGHHHSYYVLPSGVVNGSLKGYDEYAYDNALQYEPPRQAALLVDRERGMILNTPIWVDDRMKL